MRGFVLGLFLPPRVQGMDLRSRKGAQTGAEGPESGPSKPGKPAIGTETCINAAVVTIGGQGGSHGRARREPWTGKEGLEQGRAEGREQGRAEGEANALSAVARKLREMGVDEQSIRQATGLAQTQNN